MFLLRWPLTLCTEFIYINWCSWGIIMCHLNKLSWSFPPINGVCVLVAQSCLTVCDPVDCSPPDSSVPGIPQARILDLVAISYCRGSSRPGIEPTSPALTGGVFTAVPPGKSVSENRFDKTEKSMYKFLHLDLLHSVISLRSKCSKWLL